MAEETIAEYLASVRITGVDDGVGGLNIVNSFQVTPTEGLLELRAGPPGEQGPPGPDAWPWVWRGDVSDSSALEAIRPTLGPANRGYAYRVVSNNSVMYWDGSVFYPFVNAFGAEGPHGPPNRLSVGTVTTLPEGQPATATISGESPNQVLDLGIPRGGPGEEGPPGGPGPIMTAPDVDDSVPLVEGAVLAYVEDTQMFTPTPWPGWSGPWGLGAADISTGSGVTAPVSTIGTITIPGQRSAWRPMVEGGIVCQSHAQSVGDSRVDVEVRIGSETGQLVAFGGGFPSADNFRAAITPNFGVSLTPDSEVGVIPANQSVTLYVTLARNHGTRSYSWSNTNSNIVVWAQPVATM